MRTTPAFLLLSAGLVMGCGGAPLGRSQDAGSDQRTAASDGVAAEALGPDSMIADRATPPATDSAGPTDGAGVTADVAAPDVAAPDAAAPDAAAPDVAGADRPTPPPPDSADRPAPPAEAGIRDATPPPDSALDRPDANADRPAVDGVQGDLARSSDSSTPETDGPIDVQPGSPAALCLSTGGTVVTKLCCNSSGDFPSDCLVGACGCAPTSSKSVSVCACSASRCYNPGQGCVTCLFGYDQTCNDNPILSSVHGRCLADGTCQCGSLGLNPATGKCL